MQLVSVEVDVESHFFPSLQDGAGRVKIKHPLLTERVNVVDLESPSGHQLLQPRQLNLQDVLRGFCNSLPSEGQKPVRTRWILRYVKEEDSYLGTAWAPQ